MKFRYSLVLLLLMSAVAALAAGHQKSPEQEEPNDLQVQYQQRKEHFVDTSIADNDNGKFNFLLQAQRGLPIDRDYLTRLKVSVGDVNKSDDFGLIKLIRLIHLRPELRPELMPILQRFRYWFSKGDHDSVFWSENHMICYLSSQWLMNELESDTVCNDSSLLRSRLKHYLEEKLKYGFYEFFSPMYLPYTLSSLLNIYDFTQDQEIRELARQTIIRLLHDILTVTNKDGEIYSVAGRSYSHYMQEGGPRNINQIIYLLTGQGKKPRASEASAFLATSKIVLPKELLANSWQWQGTKKLEIGHSAAEAKRIYGDLPREERVPFYWSMGGYPNPEFIQDTQWMLEKYDLWKHPHFAPFQALRFIPRALLPSMMKTFAPLTKGTTLVPATVNIFKQRSVVLSSLEEYRSGLKGAQQVPWVANIAGLPVWTQSGELPKAGEKMAKHLPNANLPSIVQQDNVALITYRAEGLNLIRKKANVVWAYWPSFDQEVQQGQWRIGRKGESYVALYGSCAQEKRGWLQCDHKHQTWAVMVGDAARYGSFEQFQAKVQELKIESHYAPLKHRYTAKLSGPNHQLKVQQD